MKKILVVGGAGYVGSVLVSELLDRGYAVRVLDRLYYGDSGIKAVQDRIELTVADMRAAPASVFADVDAVINIGGLSNDPTAEYNPRANHEMNVLAAEAIAHRCVEQGISRYIFASSCSIYDRGVGNDATDILQDENSPVSPRTAYSASKFEAENRLLKLTSADFCPVILRKGTIHGYSPRMRFDLVVNTMLKDALTHGKITIHYGGEMWRPIIDIHDVSRAYIAALEAPDDKVHAQIFNLVQVNVRISELALRIQAVLRDTGIPVDINADYTYRGVRSYRVSGEKFASTLGLRPLISIEMSIRDTIASMGRMDINDMGNPRYYNIRWMGVLEEASKLVGANISPFDTRVPNPN